jgi:hypothetical protein
VDFRVAPPESAHDQFIRELLVLALMRGSPSLSLYSRFTSSVIIRLFVAVALVEEIGDGDDDEGECQDTFNKFPVRGGFGHIIGSSSLPVAPLIDEGRDPSLAAWKENRFGPSGRAYVFWTPSNPAANG